MSHTRYRPTQVSERFDRPRHRGRLPVALWRIKRFRHYTIAALDTPAAPATEQPLPADLVPFASIIDQADQAERGELPVTEATRLSRDEWRALIVASMPDD